MFRGAFNSLFLTFKSDFLLTQIRKKTISKHIELRTKSNQNHVIPVQSDQKSTKLKIRIKIKNLIVNVPYYPGVKSKADDPAESRRSWGRKQTIF